RDRGERASILHLRPMTPALVRDGGAAAPALAFATELADGRSVKTQTRSADEPVAEFYERHRREVAAKLGENAIGGVPEAGKELPWLQERAGRVVASLAKRSGFVVDASGESFYPP